MDDEQIKEASWTVQTVTGTSSYAYGLGYSVEKWKQEVDAAVEYIKKSA